MPYYCATVKILVEDETALAAKETILEGMNWLKNDENVIMDWGFSLEVPSGKGPFPREVDRQVVEVYERNLEGIMDTKDEDLKESLIQENERMFKNL